MSRSSSGTTGGAVEVVKVLDRQADACRCPIIWRSSSGMIGGACGRVLGRWLKLLRDRPCACKQARSPWAVGGY